jgi:hypothetical protein
MNVLLGEECEHIVYFADNTLDVETKKKAKKKKGTKEKDNHS